MNAADKNEISPIEKFGASMRIAYDELDGAKLETVVAAQIIATELTGKLTLQLGKMARRAIANNKEHAALLDRSAGAITQAHRMLKKFSSGAVPWIRHISPAQADMAVTQAHGGLHAAGWGPRNVQAPTGT